MSEPVVPLIDRIPGGRAFASLSRRVRTLIVGTVLFLVLFLLVLTLHVPYVVLSPGPTCNVLGTDADADCVGGSGQSIIVIKGRTANKTDGHLNMTTVRESGGNVTALQAILGWLQSDETVVPYSSIHQPGTSEQQEQQQNAQDFSESQDNAVAAAACELKYPKSFGVSSVLITGAAHGLLHPGDVLTTVDGRPTGSQQQLQAALAGTKPSQKVAVGIVRAGRAQTVTVALGGTIKGRTGGSLGIEPGTVCALPFSIDLGLGNEIGGPSAGLMFALGIIDKVGPSDLTGGRFVAGTGTIDPDGTVGPIGGIALKMIAARRAGATVFLAPADNCGDVRGAVPAGLTVAKVASLGDALQALADLADGKPVAGC